MTFRREIWWEPEPGKTWAPRYAAAMRRRKRDHDKWEGERKMSQQRVGDQLLLRLPLGLKQRLQERAEKTSCPMSSIVIRAIQEHLDRPDILDRIARLEKLIGIKNEIPATRPS